MKLIKNFSIALSLAASANVSAMSDLPDFDEIADFNNSWAGKALEMQRQLDLHQPMSENNILGTHNSYNSEVYRDIDSYLDPQQKHSIYDQLRLGARFIELDAHWTYEIDGFDWGTNLLLCHSGIGKDFGEVHVGCSLTDRKLTEGLQEIRNWLDENPAEVIILYIEDHTDGKHQELYNALNGKLGGKFYASNGCKAIPSDLSRADVLEAGKQIVLWKDGGCSGHSGINQMAFTSLGDINRIWEDRTGVGAIGAFFTGGTVNKIEAGDVQQAFKNGGNIVNLDDMTYDDGRLAAGVWSWDVNEPNNHGGNQDCAVQWGNGRWDDANCADQHFFACKNTSDGSWNLSTYSGQWTEGEQACQVLGGNYVFAVPTNSKDNEALKAAKGGHSHAWLNYHDRSVEGNWQPPKGKGLYRELRDGRTNLCLDVEGGNAANGTNVRLWDCNGSNAQKWAYDAANGFLRSALGKCLDNRGQDYNGGEIVIWDCIYSNNLRFDWVGTSLRNRRDNYYAVDAYGDYSGADVGQWEYHGGANQQWHWGN